MSSKIRIFLANISPPGQFRMFVPPLGLMYLAAYLRNRFPLEIRIVNQPIERLTGQQLVKEIVDFDADIVGFGYMTPSAHAAPEIIRALRIARPETLIVIGGPHVIALREQALGETSADIAVAGEGEVAFESILEGYTKGKMDLSGIPGLIYRNEENEIVTNPGTLPVVYDIDNLPLPAYDLIDIKQYWENPTLSLIPKRKYAAVSSSRGCPFGCTYCNNIFGKKYRAYSPERIVEEIKYYKKHYGVTDIDYVDDCFNLDKKRVLSYSERLLNELGPTNTAFSSGVRADLMDEDVIGALKEAGMNYVVLPLESASSRIQEETRKRLDIDKFSHAVEICERKGIFTSSFTMFGFPEETEEEMNSTIRLVTESPLHTCFFFMTTILPNTPLYHYSMKKFPEKTKNISYTKIYFEEIGINLSAISDEQLIKIYNCAPRKFYLKPSRFYRILRDYPEPHHLPRKIYNFIIDSVINN